MNIGLKYLARIMHGLIDILHPRNLLVRAVGAFWWCMASLKLLICYVLFTTALFLLTAAIALLGTMLSWEARHCLATRWEMLPISGLLGKIKKKFGE
tara:strand:- start:241 stop:531 length:291 start_codon:yes stop_codon:yes gene_type:complete